MALVVIGGVAAGLSAASRARRLDPQLPIVVLEKGPVVSYGACGLPYLVEGRVQKPEQLIVYTPEQFRKDRNIEVRTGARVVSISHPRREVELESGERIRYDRLVIATGARCDTLITYVKDRPGHDKRYGVDTTKSARELDYQPRESLASGLRRTLEWYLGNEKWWRAIMDGSYRRWIELQYENR